MIPIARVADLAEQIRGVSYGKADAATSARPGYLPVLRAGNITDEGLAFDDLVFVPAERISTKQRIRSGDVVIAASSGSLDIVGKAAAAVSNFEGAFGAFCKVLRPSSKVDPGYFGHYFRTVDYRRRVSAIAAGVNINNLRNEHLDNLRIPLPPLIDQRRIAAILDNAAALRAKRRATLAHLDTLAQSIFLDMFGEPIESATRWRTAPLEAIISETKLGLVRGATEIGPNFPIPYVRMNAITRSGELDLSAPYRTAASETEIESYRLRPGDFLFNTRNSEELVGKSALFRSNDLHVFNNNLMRIRFRNLAEPEYVAAAFRTRSIRQELRSRTSGTTNVFAIYWKDLRSLPIPLPPESLQRTFVQLTQMMETLKSAHRVSLGEMDAFFTSLQHRAFRGEL